MPFFFKVFCKSGRMVIVIECLLVFIVSYCEKSLGLSNIGLVAIRAD